MGFWIGQKVTMKVDVPWINIDGTEDGAIHPEFGVVYTIRTIGFNRAIGRSALRFVELVNPVTPLGEREYDYMSFAPIIERKTDISIFTKMLTPNDQRVDA